MGRADYEYTLLVTLAGVRVDRILSADQFVLLPGRETVVDPDLVSRRCHDRWTDLADAIAALPEPLELYAVIAAGGQGERLHVAFLAAGRGETPTVAGRACAAAWKSLWSLLVTNLDYAELRPITEEELLGQLVSRLRAPHLVEIRRRREALRVSHGQVVPRRFGFGEDRRDTAGETQLPDLTIDHLFPWVPSDDPWRRLLESLRDEGQPVSLVTHLRGFDRAPEECLLTARDVVAKAERLRLGQTREGEHVQTLLALQTELLHTQAMQRLALLEGRVLAARVFLASETPSSPALVATVLGSLDDASFQKHQPGADGAFRGGAQVSPSTAEDVCEALDEPEHAVLFGVQEARAVLRTPMPTDTEVPGLPLNRARTAPMTGATGTDYPLGMNVHRGIRAPVALDEAMRFRHTYVVGQTGTGKSTLLLNMILHDIEAGRGVGVLDPHGSLVEDILLRYPRDRADDLVLVDLTDVERPVPFNILRIREQDPLAYRLERDLVIDDIYSYFARTYSREMMGPIFETHFRAFLTLLLGAEAPEPPYIPNLSMFRAIYAKEGIVDALLRKVRGLDPQIVTQVEEARGAGYDMSLKNMAPYVTSKLSRFTSDLALRNITCQSEMLDIESIVAEGKVLLFYLGKGRFGEIAAGLLASQVVSRIRSAVMRRGSRSAGRPFYLYADEFQLFADERFAELLAEARKFGLSLTIAHQFTQQLPERVLRAVLGNVGTTISLRVGAPDSELLEPLFWPAFNRRDLTSLANFRACARSFGALGPTPFSIDLPPPPQSADPEHAAALRERSRLRHGRDRELVEREIVSTYEAFLRLA